ncbi:MAG: hypothetical protein MUC97_16315 [Bernardetiaceae bacterium]|nr:hypothetical protein [Bernardetiaceae bacterium]
MGRGSAAAWGGAKTGGLNSDFSIKLTKKIYLYKLNLNSALFGPTLASRTYSLKNSRFCHPLGRADPFKNIFLAKPLRRKANFELLNVPNWMQIAHSEPPKIEGITLARRGGDAISKRMEVADKRPI